MSNSPKTVYVIRRLSGSDLGWFAVPRDSGAVASKQRAININASLIGDILSPEEIRAGGVYLHARSLNIGCADERKRILSKVGKNWRLGGPKVPGEVFRDIRDGDFFVCRFDRQANSACRCDWCVIMECESPSDHAELSHRYGAGLVDRMQCLRELPADDTVLRKLLSNTPNNVDHKKLRPAPVRAAQRKLTVGERLQQPHIMQEMMRTALSLSAKAQQDFLVMLEKVAGTLRDLLVAEGLISTIEINHAELWEEVAGQPIAFVDGGMANISSLGAEPIAVRVGSYVVIPGQEGTGRESFTMEKQLVDELYETRPGSGLFDDIFDDPGKLRDAARISLEAAGSLSALSHPFAPRHLFMHGSLVNPVSPYALDGFPDFTQSGIERLLPESEHGRVGRDRNFVSVYLKQLELLRESGVPICGVVERASSSAMVTNCLLDLLKETESSPGAAALEQMRACILEYKLTDAVLFHSLLNEGEFIAPVEVNRNDLRRAPEEWKPQIEQYPRPYVTYVGLGEYASPIRCEFFSEPADGFDFTIRIIVHSCRLMPQYAFPAGLDIVDKFAKVPNWMSRPINSALAVQILKKAMQTGNPAMLAEAKRLICGTTRDWMFRPTYQQ